MKQSVEESQKNFDRIQVGLKQITEAPSFNDAFVKQLISFRNLINKEREKFTSSTPGPLLSASIQLSRKMAAASSIKESQHSKMIKLGKFYLKKLSRQFWLKTVINAKVFKAQVLKQRLKRPTRRHQQ